MSEWSYDGWVAYATMFVAALIIAADTGVKLAPDLKRRMEGVLGSSFWGFSPLALVLIATVILLNHEFGWIGLGQATRRDFASKPLKHVYGQTFENRTIPLDGYDYEECTFNNVTFMYEGTGPFQLINAHHAPSTSLFFGSTNPGIMTAMEVTTKFQEVLGVKPVLKFLTVSPDKAP